MARPWKHKRGGWYVSVVLPSRKRADIYLGKVDQSQAVTVAANVEHLRLANSRGVEPTSSVIEWSHRIEEKLHDRLVELGLLLAAKVRTDWHLGEWLDHYITLRTDFKKNTIKGFKTARKQAVNGLGDVLLRDITVADAKQYARNVAASYSSEHASKLVERVKQALETAVESRVLRENPFKDVALSSKPDKARQHYIDLESAELVLEHCPHIHAQVVFALARWCGLRVPHEVLALRWQDVDLVGNRLHIASDTKTGARVLPLFPKAAEKIRELRKVAPLDSIHVIDRCRASAGTTWAGWLKVAITKAKLWQWEKLWINCRASCRTDLEARFSSHICDAWLGHSHRVAKDHYLMVTPEDWEKANAN